MRRVLVPVGTGTTLAGLAAALDNDCEVIGVSALKGAADLEHRVEAGPGLDSRQPGPRAGRSSTGSTAAGLPGSARGCASSCWLLKRCRVLPWNRSTPARCYMPFTSACVQGSGAGMCPLLAIHTGGLQGRRGYDWLEG